MKTFPVGMDMRNEHTFSGKEPVANRNRPCSGNQAAYFSHKLVSRQDGRSSGRTGRKNAEELEKPSLREAQGSRGGEINPSKQAVAHRVHDQHRMQTEQDHSIESRRLSLTGGYLWQL